MSNHQPDRADKGKELKSSGPLVAFRHRGKDCRYVSCKGQKGSEYFLFLGGVHWGGAAGRSSPQRRL